MSRIRDIANILSASTDMATDVEVTAAISSHSSASDPHGDRTYVANNYATITNKNDTEVTIFMGAY